MPVEILGVDHVYVAVRDLAASEAFYDRALAVFGFRKLREPLAGEPHVHYYGPQLGFTLRPARAGTPAHDPYAPGLHHLCFRVRDEAAVDAAARELRAAGIDASPPRRYPEYAPDYYASFFSDVDGVRLEVCNFWEVRRRRMAHWGEDGAPPLGGPLGDPGRHRPLPDLEAALRALPDAPRDDGLVRLIVRRLPDGTRETPAETTLSCEEGVPGDDWSRRPPRDPAAQLAVMSRDVALLLANGQPLTLAGDNLIVDLDLSAENLPTGARLRVGAALVEVTPKPHNGCRKFAARFGLDALHLVQAKPTRHRNLRGIYWRVVEPGAVRVGDAIRVLSRG